MAVLVETIIYDVVDDTCGIALNSMKRLLLYIIVMFNLEMRPIFNACEHSLPFCY